MDNKKMKTRLVTHIQNRAKLEVALTERDAEFARVLVDLGAECAPTCAWRTPMAMASVLVILVVNFKMEEAGIRAKDEKARVMQEGYIVQAVNDLLKLEEEVIRAGGPLTWIERARRLKEELW
jgi:hypothetical protein